ncbi:MAG: hypothetical protein MUF49_11385 [Oculatellaceae cyanobacterium Prado106]|jgi:hypothetical protein|nr:hypothetical protein [Oculatellaceae cyanobacterium Prado106]
MSHFSDICTRLVDPQALRQALEVLGFTVEAVEIQLDMTQEQLNAIALPYANSYSDRRSAHVIARHPELRQQETAIGFLWNVEAEAFVLQCDAYEIRNSTLGYRWELRNLCDREVEQSLNQRIQMQHDRAYVQLQYPATQYLITEQLLDDGIQLVIKPRTDRLAIGAAI